MTTITDDFNRVDQSGLGTAAGGWSWSANVESNSPPGNEAGIVSNRAQDVSAYPVSVRAEIDLATDDNYAQMTIVDRGAGDTNGVICRESTGIDPSYYLAILLDDSDAVAIFKNTGGINFALIGSFVGVTVSLPQIIKVQAVGTTVKCFWDGVEVISETDSEITTGKRAGMRFGSAGVRTFDNFEAGDVGGASAGKPMHYYNQQRRLA